MKPEPRLNMVALGVADVEKARQFYETGLGWKASPASAGDIVFFQLGAMVLTLYPREALAEDASWKQRAPAFPASPSPITSAPKRRLPLS
jgi:uncharacterized protein